MVRTFGSQGPVESVVDNPVTLQFSLVGDDHVFEAIPPTGGQMMVMAAAIEMDKGTAGMVQFLMSVLSDADFARLRERLLDREDTLDLQGVSDLFEWMMEEWGKNPTDGRSGSSASPANTGRGSTARRRSAART